MKQIKSLIALDSEGWEKEAEALLEAQPPTGEDLPSSGSSEFSFTDSGNFWRIGGVNYRNGSHTVDLMKNLLDGGNAKTQDEWAAHYNTVVGRGEFHTPDYRLQHSIFTALFRNKEGKFKDKIAEARQFVDTTAHARWLMSLTRVKYNPSGLDEIIHNYGTANKFSV